MRLREPGSFVLNTRFCNPYRRRTGRRSDRKLHHLGRTFPHLDRCPCHSPNPHLGFENRPENRSRNHRDNHSGIPRPVPSIVHSPGSLAASPEFDSRWDRFQSFMSTLGVTIAVALLIAILTGLSRITLIVAAVIIVVAVLCG